MSLVTFPLSDTDRFMLSCKAVFSVSCPKCLHDPGGYCQSMGGGNSAVVATHKAREARIVDWTDAQLVEFAALVQAQRDRRWSWLDLPDGFYAASEAAAKPVPPQGTKQPSPRGVRLSERQAEEIERAAANGGQISASTQHFSGDAAYRQTINALAAKGILREVDYSDFHAARDYVMTSFGWRVYREHRLIIRRLSDEEIDASEAAAVAREQEGKADDE
jgi:hypothetical protein